MCALPGFLVSREVTLSNTSEIPMTFRLRVPSDSASVTKNEEFEIKPHSGSLPPNYHKKIQVHMHAA